MYSFLESGIHKSKEIRKHTCIPNFKKKSILYLIHDACPLSLESQKVIHINVHHTWEKTTQKLHPLLITAI